MQKKDKLKLLFIMPLPLSYDHVMRWDDLPDGKYRMNLHLVTPGLPNGPLAIAAYVQKYLPNTEIKIFDTSSYLLRLNSAIFERPLKYEEFVRKSLESLKEFNPDIIGFSCMFNGCYSGLSEYSAAAAEIFPDALITAGGHLAAALPERIFANNAAISAICFAEGEIPFLNLCRAAMEGNTESFLAESKSWITEKKLAEGFKPGYEFIEDLDEIPPINADLLVFKEDYFIPNDLIFRSEAVQGKEIMMFPTRGCPNRCIFCASQNVHGHRVRHNSAERIKADILFYNQKYGVTHFVFFDDSFLYNRRGAIEALRFIGDHGWTATVPTPAFFAIDDEVAEAFAYAGIKVVEVNIENGNQDTLTNIIHKPSNLNRAEETIKHLHNHGILAAGTVLLGFPGETIRSMMKGLSRLKTMDIDVYIVWVVTPLPGSELWDMCIEKGYTSGELMSRYEDAAISTPDFSKELIQYLYYSYPKLLNFENNRYFRAGRWKEAYEFFQNPLCHSSFLVYYYLAKCAKNMGNDSLFRKHWEEYLMARKEETEGFPIYQKWAAKELPPL